MRTLLCFMAIVFITVGCDKTNKVSDMLSSHDLVALQIMQAGLASVQQAINNLRAITNYIARQWMPYDPTINHYHLSDSLHPIHNLHQP